MLTFSCSYLVGMSVGPYWRAWSIDWESEYRNALPLSSHLRQVLSSSNDGLELNFVIRDCLAGWYGESGLRTVKIPNVGSSATITRGILTRSISEEIDPWVWGVSFLDHFQIYAELEAVPFLSSPGTFKSDLRVKVLWNTCRWFQVFIF